MCGRYLLNADPDLIARAFGLEELSDLEPRFNVAPSQRVPIVRRREDGAGHELALARWGLIPGWAKERGIGARLINARAEGVRDKPSFRSAFKARRCLVPATGFYEWRSEGPDRRQPYLIRRVDGAPFAFAGLWEIWRDRAGGEEITSCTIITCPANGLMGEIHARMPVILDPADYELWLEGEPAAAESLLRPCPSEWLEAVPVSTRVNSPRHDDPTVTEPTGEPLRAAVT